MTRTKIFIVSLLSDLDGKINVWLKYNSRFEVIDIKYQSVWGGGGDYNQEWIHSALIIYKENEQSN